MSLLDEGRITIFEAIKYIKAGKYVMPAFQREYVWSLDQIEKLWDSILLDYPIATFLFWHVDDANITGNTYFCDFLSTIKFNHGKKPVSANYNKSMIDFSISDTAVLDGQQRLTSLYISLFGEVYTLPKRSRGNDRNLTKLVIELDQNKSEVNEEEYNSKKHDIKFHDKVAWITPTQFEIRRILEDKFQSNDTRAQAIEDTIAKVPPNSKDYARNILQKLYDKIFVEKLIRFSEIRNMTEDDALEMFVRFNSGGKPLKKAEISMSILGAYWSDARKHFGELLDNSSYKEFGTDFIIRTALMLYGDVTKSNINKQVVDDLRNNWSDFKKALENVEILLNDLKIETSHFKWRWNVLIPVIYSVYNDPDYRSHEKAIKAYLMRAILFQFYSSGTKGKLQQMRKNINSYNFEITMDMLDQITGMQVTNDRMEAILDSGKGSFLAGEALYFLSLDWRRPTCNYDEDHLHPYEAFNKGRPAGISAEDWKHWFKVRNSLPNLQLLEGRGNNSKSDMSLTRYYNEMNEAQKVAFRQQAIIPDHVSLELKAFGEFYEKRRILIEEKIRQLLG